MRKFIVGLAAGISLTGASIGSAWYAEARTSNAPNTGLWADGCVYVVNDASSTFGRAYGSVKFVGAIVANYDGRFLTDYAAQNAIGSFDCQRIY